MLGLSKAAAFFEGSTLRDSTPYVYRYIAGSSKVGRFKSAVPE